MTSAARPPSSRRTAPFRETLLQQYLDRNGIPSARVESEARISRQQMTRWRLGRSDIRRKHMVRILGAIRNITGTEVRMEEIFDLDPGNPENWSD